MTFVSFLFVVNSFDTFIFVVTFLFVVDGVGRGTLLHSPLFYIRVVWWHDALSASFPSAFLTARSFVRVAAIVVLWHVALQPCGQKRVVRVRS